MDDKGNVFRSEVTKVRGSQIMEHFEIVLRSFGFILLAKESKLQTMKRKKVMF